MVFNDDYTDDLRLIKSLLIVTSLQKKRDVEARRKIEQLSIDLIWEPPEQFMIEEEIWDYVVNEKSYDPALVFCHPEIVLTEPTTSLYYRGLCGLSMKAARDYIGAVDSLESGNPRARIDHEKAMKMAQTYNTFTCSIIKNSTAWTLENGYRTIIATMGITLDGRMRNRVGDIAEERIKSIIIEWLFENDLILEPALTEEDLIETLPSEIFVQNEIKVVFGSEPDVSFYKKDTLVAIIEIKGGIDPAGALERYGAAKKSFEYAISESSRCKNIYLAAVYTPELENRIKDDRLVEEHFDIIDILDKPEVREDFFRELFHYTLRIE